MKNPTLKLGTNHLPKWLINIHILEYLSIKSLNLEPIMTKMNSKKKKNIYIYIYIYIYINFFFIFLKNKKHIFLF